MRTLLFVLLTSPVFAIPLTASFDVSGTLHISSPAAGGISANGYNWYQYGLPLGTFNGTLLSSVVGDAIVLIPESFPLSGLFSTYTLNILGGVLPYDFSPFGLINYTVTYAAGIYSQGVFYFTQYDFGKGNLVSNGSFELWGQNFLEPTNTVTNFTFLPLGLDIQAIKPSSTPEPTTLALFTLGLSSIVMRRKKR